MASTLLARTDPRIVGEVSMCVYNMRMARVNVYLPDDLAAVAKESGLNVSRLTQEAIRRAIEARGLDLWLDEAAALPPTRIELAIIKDAVSEAKDELELGR